MSGVEVAGLVLGAFPIVIQIIDSYRGVLAGRDTDFLLETLRNNELIFRNSIRLMLRSIIPATELDVLLENLGGDVWEDVSLNARMSQVGQDADAIIQNLKVIYATLSKLKKKLPSRDANARAFALRAKLVVKSFVHGPGNKASLKMLKQRIEEFRVLTQDYVELALPRSQFSEALLQELDLVRTCACGLHDALRGGWNCNCDKDKLHPVNIKLDIWAVLSRTDRLEFSLLCADAPNNANQKHWMTAETVVSSLPNSLSQASGSSASDKIKDLCAVLKLSDPGVRPAPRRRLGSLSDSDRREYNIYNDKTTRPTNTTETGTLSQFFGRNPNLTNKTRVQLALKLAWAVLQISSTGWLKGKWTKENVLLVLATPDDPMAYITHGFESSKHQSMSSTLAPTSLNHIAEYIAHASLWALGIFMLELCYDESIENLARADETADVTWQPFLTANRLAKEPTMDATLGMLYAQAVRVCLHPPFTVDQDAEGRPRDYTTFAKGVLQKIIDPLKTVADIYGP